MFSAIKLIIDNGGLERFNMRTAHRQLKCKSQESVIWIKFDLMYEQGAQADMGGYRPLGLRTPLATCAPKVYIIRNLVFAELILNCNNFTFQTHKS